MTARAEETEYKGNQTITIYTGHIYRGEEESISFGLRKAQAIDDCIDAIRAWIDKQTGQTRHGEPTGKHPKQDEDVPF